MLHPLLRRNSVLKKKRRQKRIHLHTKEKNRKQIKSFLRKKQKKKKKNCCRSPTRKRRYLPRLHKCCMKKIFSNRRSQWMNRYHRGGKAGRASKRNGKTR